MVLHWEVFKIIIFISEESVRKNLCTLKSVPLQFVILKQLCYFFKETIGFDVKALFASRALSRLVKSGDTTKEF